MTVRMDATIVKGLLFNDQERILQLLALNATAGCHIDYLAEKLGCSKASVSQRVLRLNRRLSRKGEAVVAIDRRYHKVSTHDAYVERTAEFAA